MKKEETKSTIDSIIESAKRVNEPDPRETRYMFVYHPEHKPEIFKIVHTGFEWEYPDKPDALCGYVYGHPEQRVRIKLPYPIFLSIKELKEYYINFFNSL